MGTKTDILKYIESLQLRIDPRKVKLESDRELNQFLGLLYTYPEALVVLYRWKNSDHPHPLTFVDPNEINYSELGNQLYQKVFSSFYLRNFIYNFFDQYSHLEEDNEKLIRVNEFLRKCLERRFLIQKDEQLLYCPECGDLLISRINKGRKCSCNSFYSFKFSLGSFTNKIAESIITGHIIELLTLRILRNIDKLSLIGSKVNNKKIYTSIQYAGIGSGDKENGEFDLLAIRDDIVVFVECKFNETTYEDIKDFLTISDNLYFKIKENFPNTKLKKLKVIISYNAEKLELEHANNVLIISLLHTEFSKIIKEINLKLSRM